MDELELMRRDYDQKISDLQDLIDDQISKIAEIKRETGNNEARIRQEELNLQTMQDNLIDLQGKRSQVLY